MKQFESGRSMVEMLGTLAIIGVLSIGGIAGYKYGMDKYRANETINELTVRAMGLMQQVNRGEIVELNMEMGNTTKLGYTVDAWIDEGDTRYFYIALQNIPSDVCRQMLKEKWTLPTNIYGINSYNDTSETDPCGIDKVTEQIDFEFFRDFNMIGSGEIEMKATAPFGVCSDPDKPLMAVDKSCHSCYTSEQIKIGERGSCQSVCPNRRLIGDACVLK